MFKKSAWIWGCEQAQPDEYFDFELRFDVRQNHTYRLYVSCDTDYALYQDDRLLAHGQYPDYPDYRIYDTLELDSCLTPGESSLLLRVWFQGAECSTYFKKPAGVLFTLTEDDRALLCSSGAVPCRRSAGYIPHLGRMISPQLGMTFSYDASRAASDFTPSFPVAMPTDGLRPRPIQKLLPPERMPVSVVQSGGFLYRDEAPAAQRMQNAALISRMPREGKTLDGQTPLTLNALDGEDGVFVILDMGRECAGLLDLDFVTDTACEVLIGWGEHLTDGRCRTAIRNFSCEYRANGGRSRFVHPFRRLGGRYVQLFIAAPQATLYYAGIAETRYPLSINEFHCDNLLRKRIYEVCLNTLRQCMHEHYEDCPWREQALYTMDSRNQMLCGYYAFGETAFPRACLELMSHGRQENGLLSLCFPSGVVYPIPSFSLVYFIQMREYLVYTKDTAFLQEKYPFLCELMETFLTRKTVTGLIETFVGDRFWNFYEWSTGMDGHPFPEQPCVEAPLNAFLSLALQNLAAIAETLGKADDAARYSVLAETVNNALVKQFFVPSVGLFRSFDNRRHDEYSVLTNSLCLLCGAAQGLDKTTILQVLECNGAADTGLNVIPNTLSMNSFRFDALLKEDYNRYRTVILDEIDRTYLAMLEKDATSFWETARGEADFGGAGSLCHGWTALPVYYYATLL